MGFAVVQGLVVDFIGEHQQLVFTGDLQQRLQHGLRIHGAGRIIGIDDDQGLGVRCDARAQVGKIRLPVGGFIAQIMHRLSAGQGNRRRPQRVIRRRHQHLIAIIEQGVHGQQNQFGNTVADVNVLQTDTADAAVLGIVHHRLARGIDAFGITVTPRAAEIADDVAHDVIRRIEPEYGQIADIELDDAVTLIFELFRTLQRRTADFITDSVELSGFIQVFHGGLGINTP